VTADLSATLRRTRDALAPVRARFPAAAQALDVLERDLLPRTAGGDTYLIVGIVGPNNAGKSALFNSLVGRQISPSVPTGGATRRLVGAAHPELLATLRAEPTLARFRLRPFGTDTTADAPLQPAADPTELLVAEEPHLPPMLMLVDTPDFDSILEDNRVASESPWMLISNAAIDATVASTHASKLAADVGTPPLAVFWAPHSLAVQEQRAPLDPVHLPVDRAAVEARGAVARRREGARRTRHRVDRPAVDRGLEQDRPARC
jgi:hypothetical protein